VANDYELDISAKHCYAAFGSKVYARRIAAVWCKDLAPRILYDGAGIAVQPRKQIERCLRKEQDQDR
jgi:hypothetical protein